MKEKRREDPTENDYDGRASREAGRDRHILYHVLNYHMEPTEI